MKGNGWWDRKPEKRHLEVLFTTGDLMVSERRNFQRVYDVRERVLPDWDDTRDLPPRHAVLPALLDYTCRALGVVRADWVADYYRLPRRSYRAELEQLADAGDLIPVAIEDWKEPAYVHRSLEALLPAAEADTLRSTVTTLLSPFDPVVWDRRRASTLFGFDYTIECYTPGHKRRYGYFCLPVLHRGRLVGRIDAKAHRTLGTFELKAVHVEPGVRFGTGRGGCREGGEEARGVARHAGSHGRAAGPTGAGEGAGRRVDVHAAGWHGGGADVYAPAVNQSRNLRKRGVPSSRFPLNIASGRTHSPRACGHRCSYTTTDSSVSEWRATPM